MVRGLYVAAQPFVSAYCSANDDAAVICSLASNYLVPSRIKPTLKPVPMSLVPLVTRRPFPPSHPLSPLPYPVLIYSPLSSLIPLTMSPLKKGYLLYYLMLSSLPLVLSLSLPSFPEPLILGLHFCFQCTVVYRFIWIFHFVSVVSFFLYSFFAILFLAVVLFVFFLVFITFSVKGINNFHSYFVSVPFASFSLSSLFSFHLFDTLVTPCLAHSCLAIQSSPRSVLQSPSASPLTYLTALLLVALHSV